MITYHKNNSLKSFNTFKINVKANKIVIVNSIDELYMAWYESKKLKIPFLLLGEGSNVLFFKNYYGIVIINKIKGINITEDCNFWYLSVKSGEKWHNLVKFTLRNKIFGLENLALIPGSVGAAVIQNIGAYGMELKEICNYVNILDFQKNKVFYFSAKQCHFNYRYSIFQNFYKNDFAIIEVNLKLKKNWVPNINYQELSKLNTKIITPIKIFNTVCKIRKKILPNYTLIGNAGSFFKNPIVTVKKANIIKKLFPQVPQYIQKNGHIKLSAGWLIEKCNLKNFCIGGASVYNKQALIIINKKNATGKDIILLANYIRQCIKKKFNILLKLEVVIIYSKKKLQFL